MPAHIYDHAALLRILAKADFCTALMCLASGISQYR